MDTRGYNVAIACGPSGLVVVDEDRPGGFKEFANDWGQTIPPTFTVRTGKGRHFYFEQGEARLTNSPGPLATYGCDVRGIGGNVVGPGSVHPDSGARYLPEEPVLPVALCRRGWSRR